MYKEKQKPPLTTQESIGPDSIRRIRDGCTDSFERLFKTYCRPLVNFTCRYVGDVQIAENLVQNVFVRVWTKRDQLDPSANIKAYLYTAAKNEALKHLRHLRVVTGNAADVERLNKPVKSPEKKLGEDELAAAVEAAVARLPEKSRSIFSMSKYDNLTYAEIAEIENISKKTVETHMGRALKSLRKQLADFFVRVTRG